VRGMRERATPSPFLRELPENELTVDDRTDADFGDEDEDAIERRHREDTRRFAGFRRGEMVRHPTFGVGRISDLSESGSNTRAVIEFNAAGRKTLILEYARLEPVA